MKLNPPASSSDLEVARAIARRLHQRARGTEATPGSSPEEAPHPAFDGRPSTARAAARRAAPPPPPAPEPPELRPEPELPPELRPEPPEPQPEGPDRYAPDTGSFKPEAPEESEPSPFEPEPPGGYTVDGGSPEPEAPEEPEPSPFEPELPEAYSPDTGPFGSGPPGPGDATAGEADDALSELTGPPEEPGLEVLEPPGEAGVSPEDLIPDEAGLGGAWSEASPVEAEVAPPEETTTGAEDLIEVAAPSWDDIADSCLALATAEGAMLVDPAGQVLSARGDWPEPGPEAIAGRLFSMMEKKLRDAPTRSVSAPLAGKHLTAWRVPADGGYLTVVFMAAAPLRADVRPPIDATIQASVG